MTARNSTPGAEKRLALYRRTTGALGDFFSRFTSGFCADCLEVTRRHHSADPRADVDLLEGIFPGCCHAGVGDALWVPRSGDAGRFSPELVAAVALERSRLGPGREAPLDYTVRERATGFVARGVGCFHLDPGGCRLGDLKGPLCAAYLCEPVREALAAKAGWELVGSDTDDFCGVLETLRGVVSGSLDVARAAVESLERRLSALSELLVEAGAGKG